MVIAEAGGSSSGDDDRGDAGRKLPPTAGSPATHLWSAPVAEQLRARGCARDAGDEMVRTEVGPPQLSRRAGFILQSRRGTICSMDLHGSFHQQANGISRAVGVGVLSASCRPLANSRVRRVPQVLETVPVLPARAAKQMPRVSAFIADTEDAWPARAAAVRIRNKEMLAAWVAGEERRRRSRMAERNRRAIRTSAGCLRASCGISGQCN